MKITQWQQGAEDLHQQITDTKNKISELMDTDTSEQNLTEHQRAIQVRLILNLV